MPAQKGSDMLIKIGNGVTPTETFATLEGLYVTRFTLHNEMHDSSNVQDGVWRTLLAPAGIRMLELSASGRFTDAASEELLRSHAFAGNIRNYELHLGNGDKFAGPFQITGYVREGQRDEEETYEITLQSAGTIAYTAG